MTEHVYVSMIKQEHYDEVTRGAIVISAVHLRAPEAIDEKKSES